MVRGANILPGDMVLEIGPGPGSLTKILAKQAQAVVAVEYDEQLARDLPLRVTADNLTVIHQDALDFDLTQLPEGYKVAANIPYHITAPIIRKLVYDKNPPQRSALLVQKEVAERLAAEPGDLSVLAISVQLHCEVTLDMVVPARLFIPPPKVDSQIVVLQRRSQPLVDVDEKIFFRLVKAGFSERRKKLPNALAGGLAIDKSQAVNLLEAAAISPHVRAQELSIKQWYTLYTHYDKQYS